MKKQIAFSMIGTLVLISILAYIKYSQISSAMMGAEHSGPPPVTVTSSIAVEEVWPLSISAVGTLDATQGATLSAEAAGRVVKIGFESGSYVEKGQVLVKLDTSVEQAELQSAIANLELAEITVKRAELVRKTNAISQAELDTARADMKSSLANVNRLKAIIERREIVAPYAGKSGIRLIDIGETLSQGTPVVAVYSYDPLYVNFSLPQQVLGKLIPGAEVQVRVDSYPEQVFKARLNAIESHVNAQTRNVSVQAELGNPDSLLSPGMFVRVKVILEEKESVLSIPASGIKYAPYGDSVFVIAEPAADDDAQIRIANPRTIKLGRRLGDRVSVLSGLLPGEEIVSSGAFQLRPDSQVMVNNEVSPKNELHPNPANT